MSKYFALCFMAFISFAQFVSAAGSEIVLEIMNKSAQAISVKVDRIKDNNKIASSNFTIPANSTGKDEWVKFNENLEISISYPAKNAAGNIIKRTLNVYTKDSAKMKTKYLTWNPDKDPKIPLYPQTGVFMGLGALFGANKTASGLSLQNNITQSELTQHLPN
jgi:hypothetical protein